MSNVRIYGTGRNHNEINRLSSQVLQTGQLIHRELGSLPTEEQVQLLDLYDELTRDLEQQTVVGWKY